MSSSSGPTLPALDDTLGAIQIGVILGTFLFGLLTLQTFNYFRTYTKDTLLIKTLRIIYTFPFVFHSLAFNQVYEITVTFYGQRAYILDPPHSIVLMALFSGLLTMVVETFFAFRVRTLIILVVIFWRGNGFLVLREKQNLWIVATASCVVPVTNILVAIALCHYLRPKIKQAQAEFVKTRTMVVTLIVWTAVILVTKFSRLAVVWVTFFLLHAKLLSNCMLASLNGRQRFRSPTKV
ncbi:hypothetical protein DFH08DRAFT_895978, partial [Mycena albidolilacea]